MLKNIEAKHKYNLESELYEALFVPKLILQKCIGDIFATQVNAPIISLVTFTISRLPMVLSSASVGENHWRVGCGSA